MQFLANENFPIPSVKLLRNFGYNVTSICEEHSGISDEDVVIIAQERNLVILTFDSDYGELIIRYGIPNPPIVIYSGTKGQTLCLLAIGYLNCLNQGLTVLKMLLALWKRITYAKESIRNSL